MTVPQMPQPAATDVPTELAETETRFEVASQWQLIWWKFRKHRLAVISLWVVVALYIISFFAGFFAPKTADPSNLQTPRYTPPGYAEQSRYVNAPPMPIYWIDDGVFAPYVYGYKKSRDPKTLEETFVIDYDRKIKLGFFVRGDIYMVGLHGIPISPLNNLKVTWDVHFFGPINPADPFYPFGADDVGRDMLSRLIYASQVSLSVGLVGVVLSMLLGVFLGGLSGLIGGWLDNLIQRMIEILRSIPDIPLWMALAVAVPPKTDPVLVYFGITIILSLLRWTDMARVVRGRFLSLREEDFILAAKLDGVPTRRIVMRHMVPSFMSHIIASMTLAIPGMILGESALSFLGIGLRAPVVSWGVMLNKAINVADIAQLPWMLLPGAAIFITILVYNFLGDGLRDATDPYH
ncbi:Oligopeptide transport system permease protein OppC [Anaerolineae bacterium]|nr:Oligopeptide transport system permease protein OppC [Anaerolineae bacterium]